MVDQNYTEIVILLDQSGSMASRKEQTITGFNEFLHEQKQVPGRASLTLTLFNTETEVRHLVVPINDVPDLTAETFTPGGMTALLDAVGETIRSVGTRLEAMDEVDRPGLVLFAIITDGQENSSKEYTKKAVNEMIRHQEDVYGWEFDYVGTDPSVWTEAAGLGIQVTNICRTATTYQATKGLSTKYAAKRTST